MKCGRCGQDCETESEMFVSGNRKMCRLVEGGRLDPFSQRVLTHTIHARVFPVLSFSETLRPVFTSSLSYQPMSTSKNQFNTQQHSAVGAIKHHSDPAIDIHNTLRSAMQQASRLSASSGDALFQELVDELKDTICKESFSHFMCYDSSSFKL